MYNGRRESFGTTSLTQHMFNPITSPVIILVATMIRHSIEEYRHGVRVDNHFQGRGVEGMLFNLLGPRDDMYADRVVTDGHTFITRQWFTQSTSRQETMCRRLREKLMKQSQVKPDLDAENEPVYFPLAHSLSDAEGTDDDFDCQ